MIEQHLPILAIAIPLFAAPLCVLLSHRQLTRLLAIAVCWITFGISVWLMAKVIQQGPVSYDLGGWKSPYGIVYVIDHFSAFVMVFVSGLAAIVLTGSAPSVDYEIPHSKHYLFHATYLLCMTGLMGICATGDLFNVFVFLEISSLSTYALIALGKSRRAPLAAFQYLIMGTIGATFILIGIGLLYQMTGTLNMADIAVQLEKGFKVDGETWAGSRTMLVAFAFLTIGLSIKMAVFPLHSWLPNAYTYAPSVVTSFVAATATKVSVYAFIRVVFSIFTPEFAFELLPLGSELMVFALIGIYVASIAAIFQRNIKRLLAWSSIAQIGYMLLGISIANERGLTAGIVHMFNHALIKGGLFMAVACFALRVGTNRLDDYRGVGKTMPWTSLAWVIGGLGLIGVPLTAGFVSKWLLLTAAVDTNNWVLAVLMLVSSLLAIVYVWRVVEIFYFSEPSERALQATEAPPLMLVTTWIVIIATVVFGVWTDYSAGLAAAAAAELLGGIAMTPEMMIQLGLLLPLVAMVLVLLTGSIPNLRETCTLVVAIILFWITCNLAGIVFSGGRPVWTLGTMIPGFELSFRVEPLGMLFALVASGLWILTTLYSIGYMRGHHEQHQTRFYACFAIAIFAAMGAAYAANLFTLFIAYEVMTISTYPLVAHHGTIKARNGGRVYLGILLTTSIAFFMLAIAWTWQVSGTLDFVEGGILGTPHAEGKISNSQLTVLLALFAFGIGKAALMPVHRWLPAAMVAPTPVSALLHAVAVVKVGVFSILKVSVYIFGIDLMADTGISDWLCYLAGASILLASLVAMTKDNLKARLAYSTVSQLGYITLGAALATQASVIGGGMHIAMHAVGKITLFFCAGAIYVAAHKTEISDMRGLGRAMPLTFAAFLIASISIIGLPPGGGSWSKWFLAVGAAESGMFALMAALMISSLLNIWYLIPIPVRGFMAPKSGEPVPLKEAPVFCVVPLCVTAIGSVVLFFFADEIYHWLLPITYGG